MDMALSRGDWCPLTHTTTAQNKPLDKTRTRKEKTKVLVPSLFTVRCASTAGTGRGSRRRFLLHDFWHTSLSLCCSLVPPLATRPLMRRR